MAHLTPADWQAHVDAIDEFHNDAFQQVITWKSLVTSLSEHGEDGNTRYQDKELKVLVSYNYFRSWPSNKPDISGEVDRESCMIYINSKYLSDNGYLNAAGQFNFKPVDDRFIINGLKYKASGESQVAQANSKPILHFIILKREELSSSENKY